MSKDLIQTGLKQTKTGVKAKVTNWLNVVNSLAAAIAAAALMIVSNSWAAINNPHEIFYLFVFPINFYAFQALQGAVLFLSLAAIYYFIVRPADQGLTENAKRLFWTNYDNTIEKTLEAIMESNKSNDNDTKNPTKKDNKYSPVYDGTVTHDYEVDPKKDETSVEELQASIQDLKEKSSLDS